MGTPCKIIHALAGSPEMAGHAEHAGRCWVCAAEMTRGQLVKKWSGALFTDQNKARFPDGTHTCEPCAWAMSWVQPPGFPPPAPGKKGLNLRLFSHFHDSRGYRALNKADKPEIRAWLRGAKRGPWFASIADTGQKHVLPWCPLNPAGGHGGVIRFEERNIALPAKREDWAIVDAVTDLLSWGVTKDEIERGDFSVRTYQVVPLKLLRAFDAEHGRHRGGAWLALVVWLSQRDEEKYESRRKQSGGAEGGNRGRAAGSAVRLPGKRGEPAQALAAATRPDADGSEDIGQRARLGDVDGAVPATVGTKQLTLFGDPRPE